MPKTPAPYLTTEPWRPFTKREKLRAVPLAFCPSSKCRHAKCCIDAYDNLYCQRTHESVAQFRARLGGGGDAGPRGGYSTGELEALRERTELQLIEIALQKRDMIAKWKAGLFNDSFGKYRPYGVWKHPPDRQYTEG